MNNQEISIISCLKKGGGVDVRRAVEFFSCLDNEEHDIGKCHPRLVRTQSSSLLDVLSTPSRSVDPQWFYSRIKAMEMESQVRVNSFLNLEVQSDEPKQKKSRNERTMLLELMLEDGTRRKATPRDTSWYFLYVLHPMIHCKKFHRVFRQRFRLPYNQFLEFMAQAREERWFPRWGKWNATSPLELLVLGAFRYLGRGWTFEMTLKKQLQCARKCTAVSSSIHSHW